MNIEKFTNWPAKGGAKECWVCGALLREGVMVYGADTTDHVCCSKTCAEKDDDERNEFMKGHW